MLRMVGDLKSSGRGCGRRCADVMLIGDTVVVVV